MDRFHAWSGGKAPIKDKVNSFYFTKTTAYGVAGATLVPKDNYGFAYRPDVGFILEADDPEIYKRLEAEAGPLILAVPDRYGRKDNYVRTDLFTTYLELIKDPAYLRRNCNLDFFPLNLF